MRNLFFYFFLYVSFVSCHHEGYPSMVKYTYSEKKDVVDKELLRVIKLNSDTIPIKWKQYYEKFDFTDDTYIYFKESPEEIIRLGFARYGDNWEKDNFSSLSVFMWFDGEGWKRNYEITDVERKHIVKRVEDEILSKMKYKYESKDLRDSWWE